MKQTLRDKIPPVYYPFFEPVLPLEIPEESIATCNNCTRCRAPKSPFLDAKCCDYHPRLANYLIGGIFTDTSWDFSFGQARLREKIAARRGVTPYGIIAPNGYWERRKALYSREEHSHKAAPEEIQSLLCPYYDNGACSIWKYRENLCVTYFCYSKGGKAGHTFWNTTNEYLKLAERELSKYALLKLGWPPEVIKTGSMWTKKLSTENDAGEVDDTVYTKLWREWVGREEEFYRACFGIVSNLTATEFRRITGQDREILEAAIINTQQAFMKGIIPDYLILHPEVEVMQGEDGTMNLVLGTENAKVQSLMLPLVRAFNGKRPTKEIYDLSFQILLSPGDIIQELLDKGMLLPSEPETNSSNP